MKALILVKLGIEDFFSLMLVILYLLIGVGTGMLAWNDYHNLPGAILAGFFWPFGLGWMFLDQTLCQTLVKTTFGFLMK